ncbi:hypothetical protein UYO_0907 [Lachnospiraceae bacterium JC7]|nr:hypothetical protein UYO_0907 [Lachnospiraceae bacterium JC7]
MKELTILTNNPSLKESLTQKYPYLRCGIEYRDVNFLKLLELVRDEVHKGARILTHPLDGSVKPMETPYKSILVEKSDPGLDLNSLDLIENAIMSCRKFHFDERELQPRVIKDFQIIDRTLMESAIDTSGLY